MTQGFLLAILAIVSGGKLTTSIIILALPLIDAAWVLLGRFIKHRQEIKNPLDLLAISDKTHLHHRLLDMGLTRRQTLFIEVTIFLIFCIAAYQLSGFSQQTVAVMVAVVACCVIFIIISLLSRRAKRLNIDKAKQTTQTQRKAVVDEAPEDKYAY
jgi:UDP-GlcNAc:undecaprenyl-phosphate GlcNAc-1-phosphate transferase